MNKLVNTISGRMSLRTPQRESLEILARVEEIGDLENATSEKLAGKLATIGSEFPSVVDFEREFPSLCFALATGVGKTRLMGAFITYLYQAKGWRHFFILAPNLTIYDKLIADFTPGTRKYVFQGIDAFATHAPTIITGDNYESGIGVRHTLFEDVHINIFNISKINSEVRGGAAPRIRRLSEYIGQSYFDYLAELDDLVLLMDESHRYRASAGVRAINELRPILGLELTATPFVEAGAKRQEFRNVIYSYPLSSAMADGYVKEPAVATRENFDKSNYSDEQLERLKLEDGVRVHEHTKVELEVYARSNDVPLVKPFMLVVAQDTAHAEELMATIRSDDFFEGRYRDRVITVHSAQRGEEKDETVARLLAVESPAEATEIVVHVNMLKEGWDVTNLYTIVPLRAANSRVLVEQSIGRGLRLPYGKRTGVAAVDRLTIVAHDKFQEIIDDANRPDSIIRTGVVIGRDIPDTRKQTVTVKPALVEAVTAPSNGSNGAAQPQLVFPTPVEQSIARTVLERIGRYESLPTSKELASPEIQAKLVEEVTAAIAPTQGELALEAPPDVPAIVAKATALYIDRSIDIPRVVLAPTGEVTTGYDDFDLDMSGVRLQPVAMEILMEELRTHERSRLISGNGTARETRLENYLVRALVDFNDISYDNDADLLYKLAGQAVIHLESYLPDRSAVENVLQYHQRTLADLIHSQMQKHHWERSTGYSATISKGFTTLRESTYSVAAGESARNVRSPVDDKQYIKGMLFTGFKRCCYNVQKFDSDPERRFAVLLEDAPGVTKWLRPSPGQVRIYWSSEEEYRPDFIVETERAKLMCEIKRAADIEDEEVQAKKRAAEEWCAHATEHELSNGGTPWTYVLIPDAAVSASATLTALVETYGSRPIESSS